MRRSSTCSGPATRSTYEASETARGGGVPAPARQRDGLGRDRPTAFLVGGERGGDGEPRQERRTHRRALLADQGEGVLEAGDLLAVEQRHLEAGRPGARGPALPRPRGRRRGGSRGPGRGRRGAPVAPRARPRRRGGRRRAAAGPGPGSGASALQGGARAGPPPPRTPARRGSRSPARTNHAPAAARDVRAAQPEVVGGAGGVGRAAASRARPRPGASAPRCAGRLGLVDGVPHDLVGEGDALGVAEPSSRPWAARLVDRGEHVRPPAPPARRRRESTGPPAARPWRPPRAPAGTTRGALGHPGADDGPHRVRQRRRPSPPDAGSTSGPAPLTNSPLPPVRVADPLAPAPGRPHPSLRVSSVGHVVRAERPDRHHLPVPHQVGPHRAPTSAASGTTSVRTVATSSTGQRADDGRDVLRPGAGTPRPRRAGRPARRAAERHRPDARRPPLGQAAASRSTTSSNSSNRARRSPASPSGQAGGWQWLSVARRPRQRPQRLPPGPEGRGARAGHRRPTPTVAPAARASSASAEARRVFPAPAAPGHQHQPPRADGHRARRLHGRTLAGPTTRGQGRAVGPGTAVLAVPGPADLGGTAGQATSTSISTGTRPAMTL